MASVQETLTRGLKQLGDLNTSQRIAIALGVILVVGSLASLVWWAASPELTPLLAQNLSPEDLALVTAGLDALGVEYTLNGAQVLIPRAANRASIVAQLQQAEKFPRDFSLSFAHLMRDSSPWLSQKEAERRWTVALKGELEAVLREYDDVKKAHVFLSLPPSGATFSREAPRASASVTLWTRSGEPVSRTLAIAAARHVSGAVAGLNASAVQVTDGTSSAALDWQSEAIGEAGDLLQHQKRHEQELRDKLHNVISPIEGIRIEVQVTIDPRKRAKSETVVSEGAIIERQATSTETKRGVAADQPGVQANVGQSVSVGGAQDTSKSTTSEERNQPSVATSQEEVSPGDVVSSSAAINVPYSYLVSIFKTKNPDAAAAPDSGEIEGVFAELKTRYVSLTRTLLKPPEESQIAVDWYYDQAISAEPAEASAVDASFELAERFGPAAGLGLLAVVSLMLMLRMARKSDGGEAFGIELGLPEEAIEAARQAAADLGSVRSASAARRGAVGASGEILLDSGEPAGVEFPVGVASQATLEGQEVDEDIVRVSNMIDQIAEIVGRDEDGVSAVIERMIRERRR